jgi:HEAT repeat protein
LIYKCLPFPDETIRKEAYRLLEKHVDKVLQPLGAVLNHPEFKARYEVFTLLGDTGNLTVDQIKDIFSKPEKDDTKIKAVDYLLKLQGKESYYFLVKQMTLPGLALRRHLNKTLVALGETLVEPIKKVFADGNLHEKYWALKILIDISGPKAFKQIRKLLLSKDPTVRLYAMAALEYLPGEKGLGMLFAGMLEQSPLMRYQASYVLARRGEETLREALSIMRHKGPELKDELIVIIGKILGNRSKKFFARMLVSKSADERYYALRAVAQNPDREGVRILIDALNDPVWVIRHMVCSMLAHVLPIARDELIKVLDCENLDKIYWACKALGDGRDPLSARPLMNLLDRHKDPNVRVWAARALGKLDLEHLVDLLIMGFEDEALSVRNEILSALSTMSPEKVVKPLLIQLFSGHKSLSFWCEKTLKGLNFKSFSSVLQMLVTLDERGTDRFISFLHQLKPYQIVSILNRKEVRLEDFDPDNLTEEEHKFVPLSEYRSIDDLLAQLKEMKGSDLHLNVGLPPMFRIHGELVRTNLPSVDEEKANQLFSTLLNEEQKARFEKDWEIDFSHEVRHIGRFRANIFRQRYGLSGIFRLIPSIVHTISAGESINRIVGAFPAEYQEQVRLELSGVLRGIVSQKLLQKTDKKGRVLAYELLITNHAVKNLIKEAKTEQLGSVMQTSSKDHMQTMDQSLANLVKLEKITLETALPHVSDKTGFKNLISSGTDTQTKKKTVR